MKKYTIEAAFEVHNEHRKTIGTLLRNYNQAAMQEFKGFRGPLELLAKNEKGELIGGLYGYFVWGWLEINILVVNEDYRKQGIGEALVKKAENIALQKEAYKIRLNTVEFQAPDFYKQMNYKVVAIEEGFPDGQRTYYFHKILK